MVTFSVTFLCQFSFIQAAFNPMLVAMSGKKDNANTKPKKTASPSKKKKKTKKVARKKKTNAFAENKTLKKIYGRQARRAKTIFAFKKKGVLGEADNALLKVKTTKGLSKKEKEIMEKFVKAENNDRKRIIAEIEKGGNYSDRQKTEIRQNLFKLNKASDIKGIYFYQADHWHKKE